jgi:ribosome-associated protein
LNSLMPKEASHEFFRIITGAVVSNRQIDYHCNGLMIQITAHIAIDEKEIQEEFIRASGPGGQNVNRLATAVKLRFDVVHSPSLPADVKTRLLKLGGKRVTKEGVLVIDARRHRTQEQNRKAALERLVELIQKAAVRPKARRKTVTPPASKERRLQEKHRRAEVKRKRRPVDSQET